MTAAAGARKRMPPRRRQEGAGGIFAQAPPYDTVALVLQGGGALGAYQAGVFQGLHEAHVPLNWIAGISIGAINAAVITGNPPERRAFHWRYRE